MNIVIFYLIAINITSYLVMWLDKLKSLYRWWRISERTLWMLALSGGALGVWLGMQAPIYHKAVKRMFRLWIPVILLGWIVVVVVVWYWG